MVNGCWILSKFFLQWSYDFSFLICLCRVLSVYVEYSFSNVKLNLQPWNKPKFIPGYIIFLILYIQFPSIIFRIFCIYVHVHGWDWHIHIYIYMKYVFIYIKVCSGLIKSVGWWWWTFFFLFSGTIWISLESFLH